MWASDITYIPLAEGYAYLVAILDLYSRRVLAWRLSNTLDTSFGVEALQEALWAFGQPEIFNTDQGSQFTADAFTKGLLDRGVKVSMDGKGRCIDNIFVERLWRSLKYEEVYLHAYDTPIEARRGIAIIDARACRSARDGGKVPTERPPSGSRRGKALRPSNYERR